MKTTIPTEIKSWGGSAAILIPKPIIEELGLKIEDKIVIRADEGRFGKFISVWKKE